MKSLLSLFVAIAFIASVGFLSSCGGDEDADPPTVSITVVGSPSYEVGDTVTYKIVIGSNADLKTFAASADVTAASGSGVTETSPSESLEDGEFEKNLTSVTVNYEYIIPSYVAVDTEITVSFTVTDKETTTTESATPFTVQETTVIEKNGPVSIFTDIQMEIAGSTGDNNFSCASIDGNTYSYNDGAASTGIQETIDLIFIPVTLTSAKIVSPDDATVNSSLSGWTIKNSTTFYDVTVTDDDWDAITENDDSKIVELVTGTTVDDVDVSEGIYIAFETDAGKKGILKITDYDQGNTSSWTDDTITITIKVQEDKEETTSK